MPIHFCWELSTNLTFFLFHLHKAFPWTRVCSLIISCLLPLAFSCLLLTSAFSWFPFLLLFLSETASTILLDWPVFTIKSCVSIQSSWWMLTKSLLHASLTHGHKRGFQRQPWPFGWDRQVNSWLQELVRVQLKSCLGGWQEAQGWGQQRNLYLPKPLSLSVSPLPGCLF